MSWVDLICNLLHIFFLKDVQHSSISIFTKRCHPKVFFFCHTIFLRIISVVFGLFKLIELYRVNPFMVQFQNRASWFVIYEVIMVSKKYPDVGLMLNLKKIGKITSSITPYSLIIFSLCNQVFDYHTLQPLINKILKINKKTIIPHIYILKHGK